MDTVLLILMTSSAVLAKHLEGTENSIFQCPDDAQLNYPHTERCDHYFTCVEGLPIIRGCPNNMLFDSSRGHCANSGTVTCLSYQRLKSPTDDDRIILMAKGDDSNIETTPFDTEELSTLLPFDKNSEQTGDAPFYYYDGGATPELPAATSSWLYVTSHESFEGDATTSKTSATHCSDDQVDPTPSATLTSIVYVTSTVWL